MLRLLIAKFRRNPEAEEIEYHRAPSRNDTGKNMNTEVGVINYTNQITSDRAVISLDDLVLKGLILRMLRFLCGRIRGPGNQGSEVEDSGIGDRMTGEGRGCCGISPKTILEE